MGVLFGTDGVRGVANKELTPELAFKLGRAAANQLAKDSKEATIAIGKDTRISGDMLEAALTAGILSAGVNVYRLGVLPTPGIAYLTKKLGATAGAVISASHNPVADNGIKFFDSRGYKLPDEVEEQIEGMVLAEEDTAPRPTGTEVGRIIEVDNAVEIYADFAKSTFQGSLAGLKIVVDCANGASYRVTPMVLRALGAEVICLHNNPDGTNINLNSGSTHPESLMEAVVMHKAHLGLAHDGDADRVLAVDEKGNLVDGDQIMVICGLRLKEKGLLKNNTVVVTVMSNLGLHQALKKAGIAVKQVKVGDRYVLEEMVRSGASLGGEQSGHIIFLDHNTTGDGLMTALQLLLAAVESGQPLSALAARMKRFPQVLVNVRVQDKKQAMENPAFLKAIEEAEATLGEEGRILVRPSGTEPLIRIMAEGPEQGQLEEIAERLASIIRG
ncbi:phosphoglucosamine mutase [Zhaonella formicivorans]|uniref:phosphoglucosamine mutase n=1 Tax=Zhaonella formicivorans TaxID=2528593 RepID=UPI0010F3994F|nr:phosphoglucosamine mutase [Zhaonella formicivorans]